MHVLAVSHSALATLLAQQKFFDIEHFELCKEFGRKVVEATAFKKEHWNFFVLAFGVAGMKRMEDDPFTSKFDGLKIHDLAVPNLQRPKPVSEYPADIISSESRLVIGHIDYILDLPDPIVQEFKPYFPIFRLVRQDCMAWIGA